MNKEGLCMHAKLFQLCPTLCNPMDYSPPGSSVQGILQAGILEWVTMYSSRGSSQSRNQTGFPALQVNSLPTELPGKPRNSIYRACYKERGKQELILPWM